MKLQKKRKNITNSYCPYITIRTVSSSEIIFEYNTWSNIIWKYLQYEWYSMQCIQASYQRTRALLATNEIWGHYFIGAKSVWVPEMIQLMFSDILINCDVHDAGTLFFNHVNSMSDDFLFKYINSIDSTYKPNSHFIQYLVASDINKYLNIN